ncbi:hypothetical protein [Bacillus cereus group sp. BfR-BA-01489]|uniref:hypothetical protein n=1 Tax=Bacillus cereus group sp. BfR-BA-01489 TaxID=2920358 RepID=UPI001F5A8E94
MKDEQIKGASLPQIVGEKQSKEELKRSIARYIQTGYPNYRIEKVIVENQSYIAICRRE